MKYYNLYDTQKFVDGVKRDLVITRNSEDDLSNDDLSLLTEIVMNSHGHPLFKETKQISL